MRHTRMPGIVHRPLHLRCLAALFVAIGTGLASAQVAPANDADPQERVRQQEFLRQQERERVLRERLEREPDVRMPRIGPQPRAPQAGPDLPCWPIRSFSLKSAVADVDVQRFAFALDGLQARLRAAQGGTPLCLGERGIDKVLIEAQDALIERGYVTTRVLVEPQDLSHGTLAITVVPGFVRAIRLDESSSPRATLWNALPINEGELLDLRAIEQGLENLKRVPTAQADIHITPSVQPGSRAGDSDLVVRWTQSFPWRATVSLDDSGSKATGRYQGGLTLAYDHWWTLNDLFYLGLNHDVGNSGTSNGPGGTHGNTVHYSVPYGYWLLGVTGYTYAYHQSVPGPDDQTNRFGGDSENADIRLSRVLFRDAQRKTTASLRGWLRSSRNFINDTEVEVQRRRTAGWEVDLAQRQSWGASTLDASLAYRRGTGAFGAIAAPEELFGEGTSRMRLVTADLQLELPFHALGQALRYGATARAQWNHTPLTPQDRFSIGNRYTVRGFDGESTLTAERGWLLRNELGVSLGEAGAELYAGIDWGAVDGPSSALLLGTHLTGAVIGLRGAFRQVSYELFAGQPVSKPEGFRTSGTTTGFSLNWSL